MVFISWRRNPPLVVYLPLYAKWTAFSLYRPNFQYIHRVPNTGRDLGPGMSATVLCVFFCASETPRKKTCVKKRRCLINSFIHTRRKLVKFFFNIRGQRINRLRFVTSYDGRQLEEGLIVIVNQGY